MNISKLFLIVSVFLFPSLLYSQEWEKSTILQSNNDIEIEEIVEDQDSNIYVAGKFKGAIENISPSISSYDDNPDIFIAKYNSSLERKWIKKIEGPSYDYRPKIGIYEDTLIISGTFMDVIYFTESDSLEAAGGLDVFVSKYTLDGNFQDCELLYWGPNYQYTENIKILNDGEYVISGFFYDDSVNIHNDTILRATENTYHPFFSKHKISSNEVIWSRYYENSNLNTRYTHIANYNNSIIFSGYFRDSLNLDVDTIVSKGGTRDLFVYLINQEGNGQWVRRTYGSSNEGVSALSYDNYGNLYSGGYYRSNNFVVDSTSYLISEDTSYNRGNDDLFLQKFNKSGNLQWKKDYGSKGYNWTRSIEEQNGIVYMGGHYSDTLIFGSDTLTTDSIDDYGLLLGTFDSKGNMLEGIGVNGPGGNDVANKITVDNNHNVYLGGYFNSESIQFGDDQYTNPNPGTKVAFISKYKAPFNVTFTEEQNISCHGGADGKLTVTPYFGVPSYNYKWVHEEDTLSLTDSTATDLVAGNYTVIVSDNAGSKDTLSTTLTQPDSITFNGEIQVDGVPTDTLNCFGEENGDIYISPSGGTGSYTYAWSSPEGTGVVLTDQNQTDLSSGDFTVEITDENGCTADTTFTIYDPSPVTFGGTQVTNIGNFQDGAIDLSVSGGTGDVANYTYYWDGPDPLLPADTVQDLDSLAVGGNYTAQVTDENACAFDTTVEVVDTSGFYIYFKSGDITDVQCYGDSTGAAIVSVLEGSDNLAYTWKDSTGQDLGVNDSTISGLAAGKYNVTVEDITQDTILTDSVVIEQPNPIELTFTSATTDTLTCYGDTDGVIDLEVSGGTPGYSYNWSNSVTTQDQTNLEAGFYGVTVYDDNGCMKDTSWSIAEPAPIVVEDTIITQPSCYGDENGSIELATVTSGNGGPFSYEWNDPASQTTAKADGLDNGSYSVLISDSKGCQKQESYAVADPDSLKITADVFDVGCYNGSDGAIQLDVQGGNGGYNYYWTTGDGSGLVQADKNQSGLTAASYSIELTDQNNCEKNRTFQITEPPQINITSIDSSNVTTCYGDNTGSITISAEGGTGALSYQLVSEGTTIAQNSSGDFTTLEAAIYQVNVIDDNNCTVTSREIEITEPPQININSENVTNVQACYGDSTGALNFDATGGTGSLSYELALSGTTISSNSTGDFSDLGVGSYNLYVSDENGCEISNSYEITQPSEITIDNIDSTNTSITVDASGGTGTLYYTLNPDSIETNQTGEFSSLESGSYFVEVTDDNSCGPKVSRDIEISGKSSGINQLQKQYNFRMYPNPARQEVQMSINLEEHTALKIEIINVIGNTVYHEEFRGLKHNWNKQLDLSGYNSGIYFVKIYMDGIFRGKANLLIQ